MRILVTGFEPFGGAETNISRIVMDGIQEEVEKVLLPVSFRNAPLVLQQAIRDIHPDVMIMLGQCGEEEKIRLERFAVNLMDSAKGDNDGYVPDEEIICPEVPLALKTALPVKSLCADCINAGLPTIVSNSAGLYVCNRIYFEALRHSPNSLFVHIPKNMDLEIAKQVINQIIKFF
jgi:pyroglutamyl-peptidase